MNRSPWLGLLPLQNVEEGPVLVRRQVFWLAAAAAAAGVWLQGTGLVAGQAGGRSVAQKLLAGSLEGTRAPLTLGAIVQ